MDPLRYRHRNGYITRARPRTALYTNYDFFPLSKEKIISAFPGRIFLRAVKTDNCITNSDLVRSASFLCSLKLRFRIRIRIPLSSQFFEIKPSTY